MTQAERAAKLAEGAVFWRQEARRMREAAGWHTPGAERERCERLATQADTQAALLTTMAQEAAQ